MKERQGAVDGDEARSRLYDVMRSEAPLGDRLERGLAIGVEYFGLDHGHVAEINRSTDEWQTVVSTDPPDGRFPEGLAVNLSTTFCRRTIEQEGVLAFDDVLDHGWDTDVAFQTHDLRCYHGAPVLVDDELYGTVCFVDEDPRAEPFSEAEKSFTHLFAQMTGYEIEQHRYERELADREQELTERHEAYRAVVDASFDLVFTTDYEGQFTYLSPSVGELLGYAPSELVDEPFTTVLTDEQAISQAADLFERVLSGHTVEELYLPFETAGRDRTFVDVRAAPIYHSTVPEDERSPGDIVAVQGMVRAATDRKRRERLIRVLNRVLRHNLRNDVNVISGFAAILQDRLSGDAADHAREIKRTADRLSALGETARQLEQTIETPPEPEPLDVVPLVEQVATEVDERYPAATVTVTAPDCAVACAARRLETALLELVDNAAKHAGQAPTIEIGVSTADDDVLIWVADDGPGLPEQERTVLTSGEETSLVHGSGLGLWLAHWIVTSIDGEFGVCDTGSGAWIEISLPKPPAA